MYKKEAKRAENLALRQLAESNIRNAEDRIGKLKREIKVEGDVIQDEKRRLRAAVLYLRSIGEAIRPFILSLRRIRTLTK